MRFEQVNTYAATPAEVYAMLTDPAFRERECEAVHAVSHDVQVSPGDNGSTVRIEQVQALGDAAPGVVRKVVGDSVRIVQQESWTTPEHAELSLAIPGKPGNVTGTITLAGDPSGGTEQIYAGEISVKVPLVGGKLEQVIADLVGSFTRAQARVGREWLAGS